MRKKLIVKAQNLQSMKTLCILELKQYCKNGSTCSSSDPADTDTRCVRALNSPSCAGAWP